MKNKKYCVILVCLLVEVSMLWGYGMHDLYINPNMEKIEKGKAEQILEAIKNKNKIILWDYAQDLTYEFLESHTYEECLDKYSIYAEINLEEFEYFDSNKLEFKFLADSAIKEKILSIGNNLYKVHRGNLTFFSIVIDNKIVLSGANRVGVDFWGAQMHIGDDLRLLTIIYTPKDTIRLARDYTAAIFYEDENKNDIPASALFLISNYFKQRGKN